MTNHRYDEGPGTLLVAFAERCSARGSPAAGSVSDLPALPPLMLTRRDHRRLRALLAGARGGAESAVFDFLTRELNRAVVCRPDMVPPDVVTMNSRVFFRPHLGEPIESRTLVYDDDYAFFGGTIPILTPLGVALLGLREGSLMPYALTDGTRRVLAVERVAYQPEGEGRLLRAPYRYWPAARRDQDEGDGPPGRDDRDRTVVPLRPRPQPRPRTPNDDDDNDPGPNRAA